MTERSFRDRVARWALCFRRGWRWLRSTGTHGATFPYPAALYVLTVVVFWKVSICGFTNHDDPEYVYLNPHVLSGLSVQNVAWAFGALNGGISYWHPLTWISHQLDCELFGLNAGAHHLTSMWIHVVNVILLFVVLNALDFGRKSAFFVAAFFAVHPLRAESVAWIAERKDVLYGFFWLLALYSYIQHRLQDSLRWYFGALGLFVCALMSKPTAVTLPVVLAVLSFWPGRKTHEPDEMGRNLIKLVPFIFLSIVVAMLTIKAQSALGTVQPLARLPLTERLDNALVSLVVYLRKTLFPYDLCVSYVRVRPHPPPLVITAFGIVSATSIAAWMARQRRPQILCGWLWFVLTMIPNLGIIQVGAQSMADRYTYLPLIGVFIILVDLGRQAARLPSLSRPMAILGVAALLFYGAVCFRQIDSWKSGVTLFTSALTVDENNWLAHLGLGMALTERARFDEALPHLRRAAELPGNQAEARRKLEICLQARSRSLRPK